MVAGANRTIAKSRLSSRLQRYVADRWRLFAHPGGLLRAFTEEDRAKLAELRLIPREAINLWIAIENDAQIAARKPISKKLQQDIDRDLALVSVMEGLTVEQKTKVRLRAAGLAYDFIKARERAGKLTCDDCNFDPTLRVSNTGVRPRSLLDARSNVLRRSSRQDETQATRAGSPFLREPLHLPTPRQLKRQRLSFLCRVFRHCFRFSGFPGSPRRELPFPSRHFGGHVLKAGPYPCVGLGILALQGALLVYPDHRNPGIDGAYDLGPIVLANSI